MVALLALAVMLPEPPAMPRREIRKPETIAGTQIEQTDGDVKYVLFLPEGYAPPKGPVTLTMHFHGATWFAITEHLRRDLKEPLIAFSNGEGSSRYRTPFLDRDRFERWIRQTEATLRERGGTDATRVARVDISSFSAGYGAVREILKVPSSVERIHRIVLADSMYAGLDAATGDPVVADVESWVPFAKLAAEGKKEFVATHSQVPTTYANTALTARWLAKQVGLDWVEVATPNDAEFPLLRRADRGGLHLWGYAGTDAMAHMTHARHIADIWRALDAKR